MNFLRNDKISTGSHPPTKKITPTYMDLAYLHASGGIFALLESLELSHIPKFLTQFFLCPKIHVMQRTSVTNNHFQNVTVFGVAAQSKVNVGSTKVTVTVTMNVMVL